MVAMEMKWTLALDGFQLIGAWARIDIFSLFCLSFLVGCLATLVSFLASCPEATFTSTNVSVLPDGLLGHHMKRSPIFDIQALATLLVGFIPESSEVFPLMFAFGRTQFEIFNSVVGFHFIPMMDMLRRKEWASKVLFHQISMFQPFLSIDIDHSIAGRCYAAASGAVFRGTCAYISTGARAKLTVFSVRFVGSPTEITVT